jgi:glycosyltransferase involved in cell wall biosynthesis
MKILLLAYACQPGYGSEPKNGWQWASRLSETDEVYLLTHARGREAIEAARRAAPHLRLHVCYVELPQILDPWRWMHQEKLVRFRYLLWQVAAYMQARRIIRSESIDVVHHTTWASMAALTLGWALGKAFVWGPVGGGQTAPLRMRRFLGLSGALREGIRNSRVATIGWNLWARLAARNCTVALTSNYETQALVKRLGARDVRLVLDTAVDPAWMPASVPDRPANAKPVVLWMGRLESHKALNLAIESFARVVANHPAELWVLGDGPLRSQSEALARELGVKDSIRFFGWVPYKEAPEMLKKADLFLFTSLRDSCPQPVLEAMAWGLPTVSLNHQGLRLMPDAAVLKVDVTTPAAVVQGVSEALLTLVSAPDLRRRMGVAGHHWVREHHLWSRRVEFIRGDIYGSCVPEPARVVEAAH